MSDQKNVYKKPALHLSEDWLSLAVAFGLILLAALGILGKNGIPVSF